MKQKDYDLSRGSTMNTKAKGNRRERQAKKILEAEGYLVTKAGGSLGAFDLVALTMGEKCANLNLVKCIQVKSNRKPGKEEMKQLYSVTKQLHKIVSCEVWIFHDYYQGIEIIDLREE